MKKILLLPLLVIISIQLSPAAFAQSVEIHFDNLTNTFLNVEDFDFATKQMSSAYIDKRKLDKAKESPESKPENQYPEGNWGPPSEGFRISLHFPKAEYTNGEPIEAVVLVRNISRQTIPYFFVGPEWSLYFSARDAQNHVFEDLRPSEPWGLGDKELPVYPSTQRRLLLRLDGHFKFTLPGDYAITVRAKVPNLHGYGESDATSGTATLKIVSAHP